MSHSKFISLDGQIQRTPINLDGLTDDDLAQVIVSPTCHADVRLYAELLETSHHFRQTGRVSEAMRVERTLERVYNDIPRALRW
jgi:hypothetical protein